MKPTILVICGPTASGKTSLALKIALKLKKCAIISVDARQSYKGLSVLTGKDAPENLPKGIEYFGTDLFEDEQSVNIATYLKRINPIIENKLKDNIPVILAGGSGLYLKALTTNLSDINIPPNPDLRDRLSKLTLQDLQSELKITNPAVFDKLNHSDINNPRRLIRHIEKTLWSEKTPATKTPSRKYLWIGLTISKTSQRDLIKKRVIERISQGAIKEVEDLLSADPDKKSQLSTSLGVNEIVSYLNQEISKEELIDLWTNTEMDYARRQMVWLKKQPSIIWYDESKDRLILADELADQLKKQNEQ